MHGIFCTLGSDTVHCLTRVVKRQMGHVTERHERSKTHLPHTDTLLLVLLLSRVLLACRFLLFNVSRKNSSTQPTKHTTKVVEDNAFPPQSLRPGGPSSLHLHRRCILDADELQAFLQWFQEADLACLLLRYAGWQGGRPRERFLRWSRHVRSPSRQGIEHFSLIPSRRHPQCSGRPVPPPALGLDFKVRSEPKQAGV